MCLIIYNTIMCHWRNRFLFVLFLHEVNCLLKGSPRTSTPYGRERGSNDMDKYYKASMLQDPWANLQPVSVTQTQSKCSSQQATHTGRTGRYYNKNSTA